MIDIDQEYKDRFLQYGGKTMRIIVVKDGYDALYPSETLYPAESLYPAEIGAEYISLELTDANIHSDSLTITDSLSSEEDLFFGSCEAAQMEVTISDLTRDITGAECMVTLGFDNFELVLGVFVIDSTPKENDKNTRKLIAYDRMVKFDKDVAGWYNTLRFPMTLKDFRESLCDYIGVATPPDKHYSLINDNIVITKTLDTTILNGRDVLRWICQANGVFGHMNAAGYLTYIEIPATNSVTDTVSSYREVTSEEYSVPDIDTVHIRIEDGDIGGISTGDGQNVLIIEDNPLFYGMTTSQMAEAANKIRTKVTGLSYVPATLKNSAMPWYEMGDRLLLETSDGDVNTVLMKRTMSGIQGMMDDISATGTTERQQTFSIETEIMRAKGLVAILRRTVEEVSTEMKNFETQTTSKFTQTAERIQAEVTRATKAEGTLQTKITQTAESITSEVTRAKAAEATLTSRITQTAESITSEVTRAKSAENTLRSSITQNAEAIKLKVSNGQVSSQLSVESGGVNIRGNRLTWQATNSSMTNDGTLNCKNIVATNGTFSGKISGSVIEGSTLKGVEMDTLTLKGGYLYIKSGGGFEQEYMYADDDGAQIGDTWIFPANPVNCAWNKRQGIMLMSDIVYAGSFIQTSDRKLKKNIKTINIDRALDFVKSLRPVSFNWRDNSREGFGFIAQEAEAAAEKAGLGLPVVEEKPSTKKSLAIPYANYTAILAAAIQSLIKRIDTLEKEVKT